MEFLPALNENSVNVVKTQCLSTNKYGPVLNDYSAQCNDVSRRKRVL